MRRSILLTAVGVLLAAGLSPPVAADSPHNPGGPCIQPNQHTSLESIHYYDDVLRELDRIERASQGLVTVDSAGQSGEGRELLYATVGDGDTVFWVQGRIHGNERLGTQSAIHLLDWLRSGNPDARLIRQEMTVIVIPMYNPDGAEANIRQSTTPNRIDLNRDWEDFRQPESEAWWFLFRDIEPDYALDYHHVGHAHVIQGTDDLTQFQIGHRPIREDRFSPEQWRTNQAMTMLVHDTVEARFGGVNTTLYGPAQNPAFDVTNAVISRMLTGGETPPIGTGSPWPFNAPTGELPTDHKVQGALFFEFRSVGQKSSGMLVQVHVAPTKALLISVADGSLADQDISGFDDIPYPQARACGT